MKRATLLAALALSAALLPPLGGTPASAAVVKRTVLSCADCWPTAMAFTPNGRHLFYVQRFSGEIRSLDLETRRNRLWGRITGLSTEGEQGMLGIAIHPRWPDQRWVYLYYTQASPLANVIVRARRLAGGGLRLDRLASITAGDRHNGGTIHFGPDGRLYAVTGENGIPARSQDLGSRAGKVLRIKRGGGVPEDNPFGSLVYSYGHRNSFGFAFDPVKERMWQSENGQDCDEVNRIRVGGNYGWDERGDVAACPDPRGIDPRIAWGDPDIAPTGVAFCDRCRLGGRAEGQLLVGAWNDGRIRLLTLNAERRSVVGQRVLFDNPQGVLALERHPRGRIFFTDQDGIYRLVRT